MIDKRNAMYYAERAIYTSPSLNRPEQSEHEQIGTLLEAIVLYCETRDKVNVDTSRGPLWDRATAYAQRLILERRAFTDGG
jgi:hypothetical protein